MKVLETDRLILRPFCQADLDGFYAYAKQPNVGIHAGWKPHESIEETQKILDMFIEGGQVYAVTLRENGALVGSLGIHQDKRREGVPDCKMLGYVLDEAHWGKGLMTEASRAAIAYAFEELKLKLLTVYHFTENARSRRVVEKCGFTYEGTLRLDFARYDGMLLDSCCYSITRREYLLSKAEKLGLSLRLPEEIAEKNYWDYIHEWGNARMTPFAFAPRGKTHAQWLRQDIQYRTRAPQGFVCATGYFLGDEAGNIYGAAHIRHSLNELLLETGGHIGYGIRPAARKKGYASILLALALEKCQDFHIEKALVTCDDDNPGSAKTIEANGGQLEDIRMSDNKPVRRYWITV